MAVGPEAARVSRPDTEERSYLAPSWKLTWWRFKRHRLALASAAVVLLLYLVALFPEFMATQDPHFTDSRRANIPPQRVHLFDGWMPAAPYVYGLEGKRNLKSRRVEYTADESRKLPVRLFARGHEYELLSLIPTRIHLLSVDGQGSRVDNIYLLGTDRLGRDMWSRLMYGTRISMSIGLVGVTISLFLGILLGGLSGYYGGFVDMAIQRLIEFLRSLPTIPLWLALAAAVPRDWSPLQVYFAIVVILSIIGWTTLAREVRGRFLALREEDFVIAPRLYGCSELRVIFRHMVPSFMSHIIATTTLAIPVMIISETSLSFLGLGLRPPVISWGVLLNEAQNLQSVALASWLLLPGVAVIIAVLALNFLGDGLRDAADPYA